MNARCKVEFILLKNPSSVLYFVRQYAIFVIIQ